MNPENNSQPSVPGTPVLETPKPSPAGRKGVIALVIIVIALLAIGYFLFGKVGSSPMHEDTIAPIVQNSQDTGAPDAAMDPNTVQGDSTAIADIEKDLNATDLDSIAADLEAI